MRAARLVAATCVALGAATLVAQNGDDPFNEKLLQALTFRNVGPFRMQARASAIAVPASPPHEHLYTFYLATWTGGVFKTTNGGTTFEPVFDGPHKITVGAVAVAPSNADIVWVGTGETRGARSSYPGDGVYKSTDAAKTWTNVGLHDSHHISRIVIHPTNPDIVYVGAMGHLYSANEERGVFKTIDGGKTWKRVFFASDKVGVIDLVINPKNPSVLYAATYDMERTPWLNRNAGPGSAIYKTGDAGANWTKLAGGLPTGRIGKIGLDIYLKNPEIVYAVINNDNPGPQPGTPGGCTGGQRAGLVGGEMYRTANGGTAWTKMNPAEVDMSGKGSGYIGSGDEDCDGFTQVRVDPNNDQNVWDVSASLLHSRDGGKSWDTRGATAGGGSFFPRVFGDVRTMWIDPENSDRMILGSDGGFVLSYDGGKSADSIATLPVGEPYAVSFDMEDPYNIYASLQDHEDWKGPSIGPMGYTSLLDWFAISSGDGMHTRVDPADSRWAYSTSEWGGIFRTDQTLGYRVSIRPTRPNGGEPYRSIWGTPLLISPHNSSTLYTGGEMLLRSVDRGDHWTEISPDLSTNDRAKLAPPTEKGEQFKRYWFSVSTISESPAAAGVLWVGMSDGKIHVSRNGGGTWTDLTQTVADAGGPKDAFVSAVAASNHAAGRAYVSKSGNKTDDFHPYLFMTDDFGATWKSIAGNLPNEPIHVVWEDNRNPDLLFVGTGGGAFISITRGRKWVKVTNIPNTPVLDLAVHPRERDLIVAALGRNVFVANIAPLEELTDAVLAKDAHLFSIKPTVERVTWSFGANDYLFGQRYFVTPNPDTGMAISYYLKGGRSDQPGIAITDFRGNEVARLKGTATPGINTVYWNMRAGSPQGGRGGGGGRGGYSADQWMPLGNYVVTLEVGGQKLSQPAQITRRQGWSLGPLPATITGQAPK